MNLRNNFPQSHRESIWIWLAIVCMAFWVAVQLTGCGTVRPVVVESPSASWDGTNQNSGFIGWTNGCGIITPHARDRYNALVGIYGKRFTPPISTDYGITPMDQRFVITPEALADFSRMNRWRKTENK